MNHLEYQYLYALEYILKHGTLRADRTGVGRISVFGYTMRFDISNQFPLLTTKKTAWNPIVSELLWFLKATGDERELSSLVHGTREFTDKTKTIWTANALDPKWIAKSKFPAFHLGNIYGVQWRSWPHPDGSKIDQLQNVIDNIKKDPYSSRHVVSAWNVSDLENMALPPCHTLFQFYVDSKGHLSCHLFQRSADFFLGIPFNIASYSLFIYMVAQVCGLKPGEFMHSITDAHIYANHIEQIKEQLGRTPLAFPTVTLNPHVQNIDAFTKEDIFLHNYQSHAAIKAPMAV